MAFSEKRFVTRLIGWPVFCGCYRRRGTPGLPNPQAVIEKKMDAGQRRCLNCLTMTEDLRCPKCHHEYLAERERQIQATMQYEAFCKEPKAPKAHAHEKANAEASKAQRAEKQAKKKPANRANAAGAMKLLGAIAIFSTLLAWLGTLF